MDENKDKNEINSEESRDRGPIYEVLRGDEAPRREPDEVLPLSFEGEDKRYFEGEDQQYGETELFSEYKPPEPPEKIVYYAMPKGKNRFLKAIGVIAAVLVVVMLLGVISTTFLMPKPTYKVGDPEEDSDDYAEETTPIEGFSISGMPESTAPAQTAVKLGEMPEFGGAAPEITNLYNPVIEIAEQEGESVVSVRVVIAVENPDGSVSESLVRGSGFIISPDGYIITNYHVVENGTALSVRMIDDSEYDAKLIGGDSTLDIALLKINASDLPTAALGNSDETKQGELAIAIGNPASRGTSDELINSVTVGYVSAVRRIIQFNGYKQEFLQIDTPINSGNSGGPLFDSTGRVIGIVTLKSLISSYDEYGNSVDSEGLGFAIPINTAMNAIAEIFEHGSIRRPGIGIYYTFIEELETEQEGASKGMYVEEVVEGGPAYRAGLKVGDIITHCDGEELVTGEEVSEIIKNKTIGDTIQLTILREGKSFTVYVEIADLNSQ